MVKDETKYTAISHQKIINKTSLHSISNQPHLKSDAGFNSKHNSSDIDFSTDFKNRGLNNSAVIFPNPSNGKFTLSSTSLINSVYIYNTIGEMVVRNNKVGKNKISFDICKQKKGLYYLKVFTGQEIKTYKLVKF